MLTEYLSAIKERTENITPKIFMPDDAEVFYNAWKNVCGSNEETKSPVFILHNQIVRLLDNVNYKKSLTESVKLTEDIQKQKK